MKLSEIKTLDDMVLYTAEMEHKLLENDHKHMQGALKDTKVDTSIIDMVLKLVNVVSNLQDRVYQLEKANVPTETRTRRSNTPE